MDNANIEKTIGSVKIADEVVEVIASMAASEVEGVAEMSGGFVGDIANMFGRGKSASKGIKVEVGEKEATVDLFLAVEYGVSIPDVAQNVQKSVKEAIEGMTGLSVLEINIHIQGIAIKNTAEAKETKALTINE
ncbi:MAG: Asp23/Gls24 family envelope stress response protein [Peptococcaceae bacterium]|nr:Asp23/Gls24 family envelope stress response protein [Peptococcaceae bacterium]